MAKLINMLQGRIKLRTMGLMSGQSLDSVSCWVGRKDRN